MIDGVWKGKFKVNDGKGKHTLDMATMVNKEHLRFRERFMFPIPMKLADKRDIKRKGGNAEAADGAADGKAKTRGRGREREREREDGHQMEQLISRLGPGPGPGSGRH